MNERTRILRLASGLALGLGVLIATMGIALVTSCSSIHPVRPQVAAITPATLSLTPSTQQKGTSVSPPYVPNRTPLLRPTTAPSYPHPEMTATSTSTLSPGIRLLATVPISTPMGFVPGQEFQPIAWSPEGKTVAYSWEDGIWILQEPEFQPMRLVSIPNARMGGVAWSPDGQHLAVYGDQWLVADELWGDFIWVTEADGAGLQNLTPAPSFDPYRLKRINQWLDDQILTIDLWHGSGAQSLWQVDIVSGKTRQLIGHGESAVRVQTYGGEYHWSPTQDYIVIDNRGHLVLVNISEASELWVSTVNDPWKETFLDWAPDGNHLLYSRVDAEGKASLWLWDMAQEQGKQLLPHVSQAAFAPNGSRVAFLLQEDRPWWASSDVKPGMLPEQQLPALTLGILDLTTGETVFYGPAGYKAQETPQEPRYWQEGPPVWSPDGELVVYWRENGNVAVISATGTWQRDLTEGNKIVQALWSPDGNKLVLRLSDQAWIIRRP